MNSDKVFKVLKKIMFIMLLTAHYVWSYVGPGAGLTAVGTVLALIVGVLLLLIGFVWFPLRIILRKRKETEPDQIKEPE